MTLYHRPGSAYAVAPIDVVVREVMRRTDYREAMATALDSLHDARCRTCSGREVGGRAVALETDGYVWLTCARCLQRAGG